MFHHDKRDYKTAASAAAKKGRVKMDEIIQRGMATAEAVIAQIQDRTITDRVVDTRGLRIVHDYEGNQRLSLLGSGPSFPMHAHAYKQLLDEAGVPKKYGDYLVTEASGSMWGKELLAHNVNTILSNRDDQRNLVRAEGPNEVIKAVVSDKFRRLDSRPLCDAFIGACRDLGMLPLEGIASDTKCRVRAVLPMVFEPVDNEVMLFGAEFGNSDYADGGLTISLWTMRVWCTNLAITEKTMRQVHLGARLPTDLRLSQETYRLDAETTASAVRDTTSNIIGPRKINGMLDAIKASSQDELKGRDGIDKLLGRALDKTELERVKQLHESPDEVNMPAGNTKWRLSNAVSWFAQAKGITADRKIELQQVAGTLVAPDAVNKF